MKRNYHIKLALLVAKAKSLAHVFIADKAYKSATQRMPHERGAARYPNLYFFSWIMVVCLLLASCKNNEEQGRFTGSRMPETHADSSASSLSLDALLKPANEYVMTTVPVTTVETRLGAIDIPALGTVEYDYRGAGAVAANIAGRIEKLYVRYRYQHIRKGEKLLDIYSPELLTSQQNYLYLLQNDADNTSLIQAAKERLLLLGMNASQVAQISRSGKPLYSVSVFSNYTGYITDAATATMPAGNSLNAGNGLSQTTEELPLKEGAYVEAGQTIFTVVNTNRVIVSLRIAGNDQRAVNVGDAVNITAETSAQPIRAVIDYVEPFFSGETGTLAARSYISNGDAKIPVGSQVQATIFTGEKKADWLPASAVLSLGLQEIVFLKEGELFRAHALTTGIRQDDRIQVLSGLGAKDTVAANAQYLTENESFIKLKQ